MGIGVHVYVYEAGLGGENILLHKYKWLKKQYSIASWNLPRGWCRGEWRGSSSPEQALSGPGSCPVLARWATCDPQPVAPDNLWTIWSRYATI